MVSSSWCRPLCLLVVMLVSCQAMHAQTFIGNERWYHNPLAVQPLSLHTGQGALLTAAAVTAILVLTPRASGFFHDPIWVSEAGFYAGYKSLFTAETMVASGLMVHPRRWLGIGLMTAALFEHDRVNRATGVAIYLPVRFYFSQASRFRVFGEVGYGLVYFSTAFPQLDGGDFGGDYRVGTQLNGTTRYGIGAQVELTPRMLLEFGIRHHHSSNGNNPSRERNPSHDTNGMYIGIARRLR